MEELQKSIFEFFSQFGIPVFIDGYAKNSDQMPYITFNFSSPEFFDEMLMSARIWSRSSSFREVLNISDRIRNSISNLGAILKLDNDKGAVILYRESPFFQYQNSDEQIIKIGYLKMLIKSYQY